MDILELTKLITLFDTQYIVLLKEWIDSWLCDNNLCLFHCANAHKKGGEISMPMLTRHHSFFQVIVLGQLVYVSNTGMSSCHCYHKWWVSYQLKTLDMDPC